MSPTKRTLLLSLRKAAEFYSRSPDGQYDDVAGYAISHLYGAMLVAPEATVEAVAAQLQGATNDAIAVVPPLRTTDLSLIPDGT